MRVPYSIHFLALLVLLSSCGKGDDGVNGILESRYISTNITFQTADNITIAATLDKPRELNSSVPAVLLIHANGREKSEWKSLNFHGLLKERNYIILSYDIRFHGDSESDQELQGDLLTNPNRAPLDLEAALDFLREDPFVDVSRIAVVGSKLGAELACVAVGSEALGVKTAISLTPIEVSVTTLAANQPNFQLESVFYVASELELNGFVAADAQRLFDKTLQPKKLTIISGSDASGTDMLIENNSIEEEMISWLENNL